MFSYRGDHNKVYARGIISAGVVTLCAALVSVLIARSSGSNGPSRPPRGAPDAVVANGQRLPYLGLLQWDNAVLLDARRIQIDVGGSFASSVHACNAKATRVVVVETASTVTLTAAGYAPFVANVQVCPLDGVILRQTIELGSPLAARPLFDGSIDAVRPVQSTQPTASAGS